MVFRTGLLVITMAFCVDIHAQRWIALDANSRAMGQSGISSSTGAASMLWNPARISRQDPGITRSQIDGFLDLDVEGDLLVNADRLADRISDINLGDLQSRFNSASFTELDLQDMFGIIDLVSTLTGPGTGILASLGTNFSLQKENWALSYRFILRTGMNGYLDFSGDSGLSLSDEGLNDLNAGLDTIVQQRILNGTGLKSPQTESGILISRLLQDAGNNAGVFVPVVLSDEFAYQAEQFLGGEINSLRFQELLADILEVTGRAGSGSGGFTLLDEHNSGLEFKGLKLHQLSVGRSVALPLAGTRLTAGISARLLMGETFRRVIPYRLVVDGSQLIEEVFEGYNSNTVSTSGVTLDAGLSYSVSNLVLGIGVRNLIPVEFDFHDETTFTLDPQARAGLAYSFQEAPWLSISVDADLTENDTELLPGFKSRVVGGGLEISSSYGELEFALRAGSFVNLAAESVNPVWTLGAEARYGNFFIGMEGHLAFEEVQVESQSVNSEYDDFPDRLGGSFSIGYRLNF